MTAQISLYRTGTETLTPASWVSLSSMEALLIEDGTGWVFDAEHVSLSSMNLAVTELDPVGYVRQAVTPGAAVWSDPTWTCPAGAVTWTTLGTTEACEAVVVFAAGVDDTASVPLFVIHDSVAGTPIFTCDGTDAIVTFSLTVT